MIDIAHGEGLVQAAAPKAPECPTVTPNVVYNGIGKPIVNHNGG